MHCEGFDYGRLIGSFQSVFGPGDTFGNPPDGVSDGNKGVQWNTWARKDDRGGCLVRVGVNLEGKKYKGWPIRSLILSEMENPEFMGVIDRLPKSAYLWFVRDAWLPPMVRRATIAKDWFICNSPLTEITADGWSAVLGEALGCLDEHQDYCGRGAARVTLAQALQNGERTLALPVTPHLTVWSELSMQGNLRHNIERKRDELQPAYDWARAASAKHLCG